MGRRELMTFHAIGPKEWIAVQEEWAALLDVDKALILPGSEVGPARGRVCAPFEADAVHLLPGQIWVNRRLKTVMQSSGISGLSFEPVELIDNDRINATQVELWELVVSACIASHESMDIHSVCTSCGRVNRADNHSVSDKLARCVRDCVLVDRNPNNIFVSSRVKEVLEACRATNIATKIVGATE